MSQEILQACKHRVWTFWSALENAPAEDVSGVFKQHVDTGCTFRGPDPVNDHAGSEAIATGYWQPLIDAIPDLQRETHIFMAGKSNGRADGKGDGRDWVGGTGYFVGTFTNDYLGIPANGKAVKLRWGEFCRVEGDKIVEIYCLMDFIDFMQQAGIEVLPPSRGRSGIYPPPAAGDGVMHEPQDGEEGAHTLQHIRRFIFEGLNSYDQSALRSMGLADYFDPDVHWYGPGGIGACLSFKEFEEFHQRHWLHAYPDRQVQDLDALIAEGPYSGAPGWAGVIGTHSGDYLDTAATGKEIEFNGLDFWKLENDRYVENWVFVDLVHVFRQFGVDLFERCRRQRIEAAD